MKIKSAIFASLSGSIAESLYLKSKNIASVETPVLITNNPSSSFISRMEKYNETVHVFEKSVQQEDNILKFLISNQVNLIFLAGYMQILKPTILNAFPRKIINIHPSLLPKYKGIHGYRDSFQSSDDYGGITIHYVDEGVDTGEIISQVCFSKNPSQDLDCFIERGKEIERIFYPQVYEQLILSHRSLNE